MKGKCQYCGVEKDNVGAHERFCKSRPAPTNEPKPEQPTKPAQINISRLVPYYGDLVAWFEVNGKKVSESPLYAGISSGMPTVLCTCVTGNIIPPSMIPGFLGMFPKDRFIMEKFEPIPKKLPVKILPPIVSSPIIEPESPTKLTGEELLKAVDTKDKSNKTFLGGILSNPFKRSTAPPIVRTTETEKLLARLKNETG